MTIMLTHRSQPDHTNDIVHGQQKLIHDRQDIIIYGSSYTNVKVGCVIACVYLIRKGNVSIPGN